MSDRHEQHPHYVTFLILCRTDASELCTCLICVYSLLNYYHSAASVLSSSSVKYPHQSSLGVQTSLPCHTGIPVYRNMALLGNPLRTSDFLPCIDQTLVERLLAAKVDIALTDARGRTALLHSVIRKHDSITHLILAHHSALVRSRLNDRKGGNRWGRSSSGQCSGADGVGMGEGSGVPDVVSDLQVGTQCYCFLFGGFRPRFRICTIADQLFSYQFESGGLVR